jgi:HD-GYP domain-containing protein (c-di-GMP phosphodiesterase class II)
MQTLFIRSIDRDDRDFDSMCELVQALVPTEIVAARTIQDALQLLGEPECGLDLVILDYAGQDAMAVRLFLQETGARPCVVLASGAAALGRRIFDKADPKIAFAERDGFKASLSAAIQGLIRGGALVVSKTPDAHFIAIAPETLAKSTPLKVGVYFKLAKDHYVKLMNSGDAFTREDASKYARDREVEAFYLHRDQCSPLLKKQAEAIEKAKLDPAADPNALRELCIETLEVFQELTRKMGFTPETQELAAGVVQLTLKAIGTDPKLEDALKRLKKHTGKYISSHSLMLAEVCCAVAHAAGWDSAGTFVKLALASVLHDLPMKDNGVARLADHHPERVSELSAAKRREVELHPIKAAEYARKLTSVPADVDRILLQHHERPDGSGFPRGLSYTNIDPLSACFIVGHDLLHYFVLHPEMPSTLADFVKTSKNRYSNGNFKKIISQLGVVQ